MNMPQFFMTLLIAGSLLTLLLGARLVWLLWRMHRELRRVERLNCPTCNYPLRFNGSHYWCSECGYRHPLRV